MERLTTFTRKSSKVKIEINSFSIRCIRKITVCCYTVVYTSTRCLVHAVTYYLHCFERLVVHNIDSLNVGPPPCLSPTQDAPPMGPFLRDYGNCVWSDYVGYHISLNCSHTNSLARAKQNKPHLE